MNESQTYPLSGCVVFWDNEPANLEALHDCLIRHGFGGAAPDQVTNEKALRQAISRLTFDLGAPSGKVWMIRGLKNLKQNGYEAKMETKDEIENTATQAFRARIQNGRVDCDAVGIPSHRLQNLQSMYEESKETVPGADVGAVITRVIRSFTQPMSISLRPMGGLYWVPDEHKRQFVDFCNDLESSCPGNKVTPNEWRMNPKGLRAVKDNMVREMKSEAKELMEAVIGGRLGDKALENRMKRCVELQDEIELSEDILGDFAENLKNVLQLAQNSATNYLLNH